MLSSKNLERLRKVLNITVPNYLSTEEKLKCLTSKDVAEIFGLSIDCINIIFTITMVKKKFISYFSYSINH